MAAVVRSILTASSYRCIRFTQSHNWQQEAGNIDNILEIVYQNSTINDRVQENSPTEDHVDLSVLSWDV